MKIKVIRIKDIHFYANDLVNFEIIIQGSVIFVSLYFNISKDLKWDNYGLKQIVYYLDDDFDNDYKKRNVFMKNLTEKLERIIGDNKIEIERVDL